MLLRSAPIAVRIPVSGERRSCETARRSAVLTRSLRLSVSASSASRSRRSRSAATASSAASAGRNRRRTSRLGSVPGGVYSVPTCLPAASSGCGARCASPPAGAAELDLDVIDAQHAGSGSGHLGELLLEAAAAQEVGGESRQQRRLALALLGGGRATTCARGELADDDRRRDVDREREPVLAVRERERVPRRQEEPVEREHARDRDRHREADAPDDGHRQHREDVENAEAEHRHPLVEQCDHGRDRRDRGRTGERGDPVMP